MISREYIERKASIMSRSLEELAPTYRCDAGRNPIRVCEGHPAESECLHVLALLEDVFFPGYRTECVRGEPIETLVIERLDEAYDILYRQVRRALPLRWKSESVGAGETLPIREMDDAEVTLEAERVLGCFFARLTAVRELLKLDVVAAYHGDPAARGYSEVILSYPGIRAITAHRVAHELYRLDVPLIPRIIAEHIHARTGIEIHPGATIGESFFIDHGSGVVIGETTLIGNRVRIYQGVTLGAYTFKLDEQGHPVKGGKRHPTIEDDVVIYPGATILGGNTVIGRGAVIGGNVWVTESVAPGSKVQIRFDGSQITQVTRSTPAPTPARAENGAGSQ
jgi:serine O-acetyltransferase